MNLKNASKAQVITEDLEYSQEFAEMILNEHATGDYREMDVDAHLAKLDKLIRESGVSEADYQAHLERMRLINEGIVPDGEE